MKKEDIRSWDENGKPHGYWEEYFTNNNLFRKGCFIHGINYGLWERYWYNGELMCKGLYLDGDKHAYWEEYNFNRELIFKGNYYFGKMIHQTTKNKLII